MKDPIEAKVTNWETIDNNVKYREINSKINHLSERLYQDYEPMIGPFPNFLVRLNKWIENLTSDEDQKRLFELVPNLFYLGHQEMNVLYREAYNTIFAIWVIEQLGLKIGDKEISTKLQFAISETWFCPLTDSMRINQFYHINNIYGKHDYRPDWRSLVKFGDPKKILDYIETQGIKRIVLLEDFIGNGGQVSKAIMFAIKELPKTPILVVPLLICPNGVSNSMKLMDEYPNIKIRPVIILTQECFISEISNDQDSVFVREMRTLLRKTYQQVTCSNIMDDAVNPYGPFGWRRTGGLVIMHTNTPNNTIPIIHNQSRTWNPLFKRHKRI